MKKNNFKKGFTLIELLVVVAIVAILTGVILSSMASSKNKGVNAGVKENLVNALAQAEIFYISNTAAPNSYTNVCSNAGPVGGINTIAQHVTAAAKASGLSGYTRNTTGSLTTATCNDSPNAWAAEAPLRDGGMWCVDGTGKSRKETTSIGAGYNCQ